MHSIVISVACSTSTNVCDGQGHTNFWSCVSFMLVFIPPLYPTSHLLLLFIPSFTWVTNITFLSVWLSLPLLPPSCTIHLISLGFSFSPSASIHLHGGPSLFPILDYNTLIRLPQSISRSRVQTSAALAMNKSRSFY